METHELPPDDDMKDLIRSLVDKLSVFAISFGAITTRTADPAAKLLAFARKENYLSQTGGKDPFW